MTIDFHTLMDEAQPAEKTVPICLRGDLLTELDDLERQYQQARNIDAPSSMEGGADAAELRERILAARQLMRDATYPFKLRALPPPAFRELRAKHPPRRDENDDILLEDRYLLANRVTFLPVLIRASLVDPQLDEADWKRLSDEGLLNDGQLLELEDAAWFVNRERIDVPFSLAVSPPNLNSDNG